LIVMLNNSRWFTIWKVVIIEVIRPEIVIRKGASFVKKRR